MLAFVSSKININIPLPLSLVLVYALLLSDLYAPYYVISQLEFVYDASRLGLTSLETGRCLFRAFVLRGADIVEYNEVDFSFW